MIPTIDDKREAHCLVVHAGSLDSAFPPPVKTMPRLAKGGASRRDEFGELLPFSPADGPNAGMRGIGLRDDADGDVESWPLNHGAPVRNNWHNQNPGV